MRLSSSPVARRPPVEARGFSLLEATVALALLGLAGLIATALIAQLPLASERIEAKRVSYRMLANTLEAVRSDAAPPTLSTTGTATGVRLASGVDLIVVQRIELAPTARRGLLHARLEAVYELRGATHRTEIETLLWRPR